MQTSSTSSITLVLGEYSERGENWLNQISFALNQCDGKPVFYIPPVLFFTSLPSTLENVIRNIIKSCILI